MTECFGYYFDESNGNQPLSPLALQEKSIAEIESIPDAAVQIAEWKQAYRILQAKVKDYEARVFTKELKD